MGEIWFKTDDDNLFNESLNYFEQSGFEIKYKTYDLHSMILQKTLKQSMKKCLQRWERKLNSL